MKNEAAESGEAGQIRARGPLLAGIARRWRWPVRIAAWGGAAATAFAFWCPAMLEQTGRLAVLTAHSACMLRTFGLQCGVGAALGGLVALAFKLRRSALLAIVVAAVWLIPEGMKFVGARPASPGGETLTVLCVNALYGRGDAEKIAQEAKACDADVVLIQEYTPQLAEVLRPAMGAYIHRVEMARDDAFGQGVFSRRPFDGPPRIMPSWSRQPQISVLMHFDGTVVCLTDVHLLSPTSTPSIVEQRLEASRLGKEVSATLAKRGVNGLEQIMGGDFNGTVEGHILAPTLNAGLIDSWRQGAGGRGGTWPVGLGVMSYLGKVRIDNLLHSDGLVCVAAGVGGETGSDHLPTWARYARKR